MKIRFKISIHDLYIFILLFGIWPAEYFKHLPHGGSVIKYFSLVVSLYILLFIKAKTSKLYLSVVLFESWMVFDTILQGYSPVSVFIDAIKVLAICKLTEKELKRDECKYLCVVCSFLSFYMIANFISIIIFPNGLWTTEYTTLGRYYFVGYENNIILTLFPLIIITSYMVLKRFRISNFYIIGIIVGVLSLFLRNCITGILIIIGFAIMSIILNFSLVRQLFNKWMAFIAVLFMFLSITIFNVQKFFAAFFINVLQRDITFTLRTYIWEAVIKLIKRHILFGYGSQPIDVILKLINSESMVNLRYAIHAHNLYLDILYKGGIIGLILWLSIVIVLLRSIREKKSDIVLKNLLSSFFIYLFIFIIEPYPYMLQLFYMELTLIYCYGRNKLKSSEKSYLME